MGVELEIRITCKGSKTIPIDRLKNFQGNLKELKKKEYEKLERSILKYGFSFPVFIWGDYILDGHQRLLVVKNLIADGYVINNIPVVEIEAETKKDAAEKLLMLNSQYAEMTNEGLYEYLNENSVDIEELVSDLNLVGFDMDRFKLGWFGDENNGYDENEGVGGIEYQILIDCNNEYEQRMLLEKFKKEGLKCRPLIL